MNVKRIDSVRNGDTWTKSGFEVNGTFYEVYEAQSYLVLDDVVALLGHEELILINTTTHKIANKLTR